MELRNHDDRVKAAKWLEDYNYAEAYVEIPIWVV